LLQKLKTVIKIETITPSSTNAMLEQLPLFHITDGTGNWKVKGGRRDHIFQTP
jgi:hypothetical protein